jgi:hypothetical protein
MNPGMLIHGESRGGKLCLTSSERARLIWVLNQCPGPLEIVIRKPAKERSINQNKYYWGVVLASIAEKTGDSTNYLHKHFKSEYLGPSASTTDLSTKAFQDYIEQIKAFASTEYNILIPDAERIEFQ